MATEHEYADLSWPNYLQDCNSYNLKTKIEMLLFITMADQYASINLFSFFPKNI